MINIGYFCSGGYSEVGGIQAFLEKVNPNVRWIRCFPAVNKPAPKKGKPLPTPKSSDCGITGEQLKKRMLERIRHNYFERDFKYDLIILIDDMDCRFNGKNHIFQKWTDNLGQLVNESLGREVCFEVLFASPELETWFYADWEEGFGKEYPQIEVQLRNILNKILENYQICIELFGGPLVDGSCKDKVSEIIQDNIYSLNNNYTRYMYSKRTNGGAMLKRIRPEVVNDKCRIFFSKTYLRISGLT